MTQIVFFKSPLGITKIVGDVNGISEISVSDEGEVSVSIPKELKPAVIQLQDYFEGKRTHFNLKLNPKGTEFQQRVWQELLNIPFGKPYPF